MTGSPPHGARKPPRRTKRLAYLVTCEHGGNEIPPPYIALFRTQGALLASHRGYDPGALAMAQSLARALDARLLTSTISRLLVELNRSPGRQFRYSSVMRSATSAVRAEVCQRYYTPHWTAAEAFVRDAVATTVCDAVGVPPVDVVLVRPGTLPKTSSGKLQRSLCRDRYHADELESV